MKENILKFFTGVLPLIFVGILTFIGLNDYKGNGLFYVIAFLMISSACCWAISVFGCDPTKENKKRAGKNLMNISFDLFIIALVIYYIFLAP